MTLESDTLRAPQPSRAASRTNIGHIRGVEATAGGLIRSTLLSGAAAIALLGIVYLPAEYGIDPTGFGAILGLTGMGQIKQQLYAEAEADDAAAAAAPATDPALLARLEQIEAQLAAIRAVIGAPATLVAPSTPTAEEPAPEPASKAESASDAPADPIRAAEPEDPVSDWRDEVSYILAPGEGIEVKLAMQEGQIARFEWTANGSVVNYDTHGDGSGQKISYETGRGVAEQSGDLTAAFTGNHGWFWRNRTEAPVTVTLRTAGQYEAMKRP